MDFNVEHECFRILQKVTGVQNCIHWNVLLFPHNPGHPHTLDAVLATGAALERPQVTDNLSRLIYFLLRPCQSDELFLVQEDDHRIQSHAQEQRPCRLVMS